MKCFRYWKNILLYKHSKKIRKFFRIWLMATMNSMMLLLVSYLLANISNPLIPVELTTYKYYEYAKSYISRLGAEDLNRKWKEDILLVNTSYAKELEPYYGNSNFQQGNIPVTDRKLLYEFLRNAHKCKNYKYIVIDIQLDQTSSPYTDSLYQLLPQMSNVVLAKTHNVGYSAALDEISGLVDYAISPFEKDFVRFDFENSLPLKVYKDLSGHDIADFCGILYFDKHRLCHKSMPLHFFCNGSLHHATDDPKKYDFEYKNLEADFVYSNSYNNLKFQDRINNKIVIIGDLFDTIDIHNTYVGTMSGCIILLNAIINLLEGKHFVNWWCILILFVVYTSVFLMVISKKQIKEYIKSRYTFINTLLSSQLVRFSLSFIGYGFLFNILSLILYICMGVIVNAWYPTIWFTVIINILLIKFQVKKS